MKKILAIFALSFVAATSYAGVARFSYQHVVKPVAKVSAHAAHAAVKFSKRVLW